MQFQLFGNSEQIGCVIGIRLNILVYGRNCIIQILTVCNSRRLKNEAGLNRFVMTPTKWIAQMNAIGITVKAGRNLQIIIFQITSLIKRE